MDPSDVAPLVLGVFFIVTTAAVILLRPITKRLGSYLEVLAEERRRSLSAIPMERADALRLLTAIENLEKRLEAVEDQQDFTQRLLSERVPHSH
ncbi:MAG TPA: hypothetical protein VFO52_11000 [Longimicrobiales bacterium]|nr:hypothetical protein [Longimicrobiales bacterium]